MNKKDKIFWISGFVAFISGLIAFFPHDAPIVPGFINAFYNTFVFMAGDGGHDLVHASIFEQIAAVAVPIFVGSAFVLIFYKKFKNFFYTSTASNHTVICGLGNMGFTLAKDILQNHPNIDLFILEKDPNNPNIEVIEEMGAIVITGDAMSSTSLEKIKIHTAENVILLTGRDIENIEIACEVATIIKQKQSDTKIYIHLDNRDNYDLLSSNIFKDKNRDKEIDIKSFSIYDLAAQTLFMRYPLDSNADTLAQDIVKIAIVGYDKVAEAILYRALNLGHFYNLKPIEITIFDEDINQKRKQIEKSYPMLFDQNSNEYWKITLKDETQLYLDRQISYSKIIFCDPDIENSFTDAQRIKRLRCEELANNGTELYLFGDVYHELVNVIEENGDKSLRIFGLLYEICSYDVIINEKFDAMAKETDRRYNQLHGYNSDWHKLSAFKRDSNRMQVEHLPIKLKVVNHFLNKQKKYNDYETLKEKAKTAWFKHDTKIIWDELKDAKILAENLPYEVLERLARVEHNRWNAFHILNGWKKKDIPKDTNKKIEQDKIKKLHPCLVPWEELDIVSKNHHHDYKSDDIETVMRISDMTKHLNDDNLKKCYLASHIIHFRDVISKIKSLESPLQVSTYV